MGHNDCNGCSPSTLAALGLPVLRGTGTSMCIEKCAECGGNLRVIAGIEDPQLSAKILAHVCSHEAVTAQAVARGPPGAAMVH